MLKFIHLQTKIIIEYTNTFINFDYLPNQSHIANQSHICYFLIIGFPIYNSRFTVLYKNNSEY